tara:strand:- start:317 stop:499 length:183 start_codon:yes stop_codon:yes gene_type:complete
MKSKGLGDTIEKITKTTGIKTVVDKIKDWERSVGFYTENKDCGCNKRKDKLNKLFPYNYK